MPARRSRGAFAKLAMQIRRLVLLVISSQPAQGPFSSAGQIFGLNFHAARNVPRRALQSRFNDANHTPL